MLHLEVDVGGVDEAEAKLSQGVAAGWSCVVVGAVSRD